MIGGSSQRIDKWLWHARMFKTRTLAAAFAASGKVRLNGVRVAKSSQSVEAGDVLTFVVRGRVRVLKVAGLSERRGSFPEAVLLYEDLSPQAPPREAAGVAPLRGGGRPTKKDRRAFDRFAEGGE